MGSFRTYSQRVYRTGRSLPPRLAALSILGIALGPAQADWTGVEVSLANIDTDWVFEDTTREAQANLLSMQVEEKTATGLRVGASLGYMSLRLVADSAAETRKFDARFLAIYLNQSVPLTRSLALYGQLNLRYNSGRDDEEVNPADIDWSEIDLQLGASWRFAHYRITPFVTYSDIDGDIDDDSGTQIFELDDPVSAGISFDYFTDSTAFVRLEIHAGNRSGGYLTFARRY